MIHYLFQDYKQNKSNVKARIVLFHFRLAQLCRKAPKPFFYILIPYLIFYRVIFEWTLGIELPWNTQIGKGLKLYHGQSLVVNDHTIIGENCTLRHNTTIGHKELANGDMSDSPRIGNNVDIGPSVCIIGPVTIGDNVKIGAGTIVVKDLKANSIYAGNPAKLIKELTYETD